jgi:hypothetical protein
MDFTVVRMKMMLEARRRDFVGGKAAAHRRPRFKYRDFQPRFGKISGGYKSVVATTNNDAVELSVCHIPSPRKQSHN